MHKEIWMKKSEKGEKSKDHLKKQIEMQRNIGGL